MARPISSMPLDATRDEPLARRPIDQVSARFSAKSAAPNASHSLLRHPALDRAAAGTMTLFNAPAGYLLADSLAAALAEQGRSLMWLRLSQEDRDPATFLVSLIAAAQRLRPAIGAATLEHMRRYPGPISGWPRLFAELAHELIEELPASSALVFEHSHHLNHTHPTMDLLCTHLLAGLPDSFTCILTTHEDVPHASLPPQTARRGIADVRLDAHTAHETIARAAHLPGASIRKAVALSDGRAVVLAGLCEASAALGPALIQQMIERAGSLDDLLARIARAWLTTADADGLKALALASRLEYTHPEIVAAALGRGAAPVGPWLQPLDEQWARVRSIWQAPLRAVLRAAATPDSTALRRSADYLIRNGAAERAVSLYFQVGDIDGATQAIAGAADRLMCLGQWETLGDWIERLPAPSLRASPWLVYAGGEIAAARGDSDAALRAFAVAASLFTADHNAEGACQSLLAESAMAAWCGDNAHARTRALSASAMAEAAGLAWHQGWAAWHLGCLAAIAGELDGALVYFGRAAAAADVVGDPVMIELLRMAEALALHQRQTQHQREFHRQAYFAAEQAEREAAERLHQMLSLPPNGLDDLLDMHGWSRTPLMLKLPAPAPPEPPALPASDGGLWGKLLGMVGLRRKPNAAGTGAAQPTAPPIQEPIPPPSQLKSLSLEAALALPSGAARELPPSMPHLAEAARHEEQPVERANVDAQAAAAPSLTVYLFGSFRALVNDQPVESWRSGRGRAIFKYLLTHRERAVPRDVLMDTFWPEADSEAARNSLNVALYGLRKALETAATIRVVILRDAGYRLNPEIHVWSDVEEFERHVQTGRRFEETGDFVVAAAEYEVAIGLYQGDFMADDPYEEWPVLTREQLRVAYLDILDRLGHLYFSQGQYAACARLCQLTLAQDNCREDAHCRLMRCYSRQGQHHLALRQYQACVEALRAELDVEPSAATAQLHERVRLRERV